MTLVSPSQSNPGDEIRAASINTPVNEIAAVINGNIDDTNIASVSGSKIANSTVATAKLQDGAVTNDKVSFTAGADASGSMTLGSGVAITDSYLTKINNLVILTGHFTKTSYSNGDTVLTLPVGYRPVAGAIRTAAHGVGTDKSARVDVGTSGVVTVRNPSASTTALNFLLIFPVA